MTDESKQDVLESNDAAAQQSGELQLERGTYDIIRNRLAGYAKELQQRLGKLNDERRNVFGSIPTELISTQRITTSHNCTAQDIVPIGKHFIFGYNVMMGLKSTTKLEDVFAIYRVSEDETFHEESLELLNDATFHHDFEQLYKYYKQTRFAKFQLIGPHLYMIFQVGKSETDIKTFKFLVDNNTLKYIDGRSEHEAKFPNQHDFRWKRTHRDLHRSGDHPHISIEDRVFVETVGGDLTVKIEDNTESGEGIYAEPVDDPDQTLDDAEIYYSIVGNIILMKIRPFKEDDFRYVVFNEKIQSAIRLDAIENACISLPEDHGLMFSNGYYLQSGQHKTFENDLTGLLFEKRIVAPNGEDYLYVFFSRQTGHYVLLSYNMIERQVETPIICNGFSIFDNGHLVYFRSDESAQKHHAVQIWQTPYVGEDISATQKQDSYLFKIGNREIVRAMAECNELINLIGQEDSYANLYVDLVKNSTDIIDSYFWINEEQAFKLSEPLKEIQTASTAAVDEFDKVVRVRKSTQKQFDEASKAAGDAISTAAARHKSGIDDYVQSLSELRLVRGQVISLKELKYVDLAAVEQLESDIVENTERLSRQCVEFLLRDDSLDPYSKRVDQQRAGIDTLETVAIGRNMQEEIAEGASQLEMLIDIVSNLKIDDATQRTQIIDNISAIYSNLNQTRATLKKKMQELMSVEGAAEFNSQLKLLSQAVSNYLDVCDSPDRCDEYLTKMMVQVEEIEGRFAEFDEYVVQLAEKREEIYAAFDNRKLQLVEARNRRSTALMSAADRILNGIRSRVSKFDSIDQINSYFASDLMIEKVRDIVDQLVELEESVKVDDVQSRLKTVREDAVRQLRDKNELFVDGQNVIQFGEHKFSVNVQPLDLTTVIKDGEMLFHLSGTNFFESIDNDELLATRATWDQQLVSENRAVYRAEYLAYKMLQDFEPGTLDMKSFLEADEEGKLKIVQQFMSSRYSEGYVKGVHDHDAVLILNRLLELDAKLGLLKYPANARALANLFWSMPGEDAFRQSMRVQLDAVGQTKGLFEQEFARDSHVTRLHEQISIFANDIEEFDSNLVSAAANYLYDEVTSQGKPIASTQANAICVGFEKLVQRGQKQDLLNIASKDKDVTYADWFRVFRNWVTQFVAQSGGIHDQKYINEAAVMLLAKQVGKSKVVDVDPVCDLEGLVGDHPILDGQKYTLDYHDFSIRVNEFETVSRPKFESYLELKSRITEQRRSSLRLEEFKPRVLSSFVRSKLINDVYLPMVGANLAKQMGVVGEEKRTDLMGLLLLISPPGYGKTTLMEYIANRLGITFMKINGPAIGHQVTSLDPAEAPNASAREEIEKLNLSLEMGDNVMIYLDDIQHCNPEFLQKFISLCDATRRIEGVFQGRTRTYDLRGRKVCVVMAGNPYTESGEKFQIPDMLSNRADTYNLGDVIGDNQDVFELSYLENCITSNSSLSRLNSGSRQDIYTIIKMAGQNEPSAATLEGNYSIEEINEFVSVMRKLLTVRDVILKVNKQYIESAAQADEYRTEPAFKLQGSYRDMNKIAERVASIMNEEELDVLIESHYENQAQTLTTGAQANLLKFNELIGKITDEEASRWEDIKRTFKRNLMLGAAGKDDQIGQVIAQMSTFSDGLHDIKKALNDGLNILAENRSSETDTMQTVALREVGHAVAEFAKFNEKMETIGESINALVKTTRRGIKEQRSMDHKIQVVNKVPFAFLDVLRNQFRVMQTWIEPIMRISEVIPEAEGLLKASKATEKNYHKLLEKISEFKEQNAELFDSEEDG